MVPMIIATLITFLTAHALPSPLTPAISQEDVRIEIQSNDWQVRAAAVAAAKADAQLLAAPQVRAALVQLLDRETRLISDIGRAHPDPLEGSSAEDYGEYYARLLDIVASIVDSNDIDSVSVIVRARYDGGDLFAEHVARFGESIIPALLELADGPDASGRARGIMVIGYALRQQRTPTNQTRFSSQSVRQLEVRLHSALSDNDSLVRQSAIHAAVAAGDVESLPRLETIRTSDVRSVTLPNGVVRFPLRGQADAAIKAIQAKPLPK